MVQFEIYDLFRPPDHRKHPESAPQAHVVLSTAEWVRSEHAEQSGLISREGARFEPAPLAWVEPTRAELAAFS